MKETNKQKLLKLLNDIPAEDIIWDYSDVYNYRNLHSSDISKQDNWKPKIRIKVEMEE